MKPSKERLRRRAQVQRWALLGHELERVANNFALARRKANKQPSALREARLLLYKAALDFSTAVDGEET